MRPRALPFGWRTFMMARALLFAVPLWALQSPSPGSTAQQPAPTPSSSAAFGEITGTVKSGSIPLPGVTVSAANSLTGKKYVTSTDVDGSFKISVGGKGRYVVRAEFSAFAPVTQEIVINAENRQ